MTQYYIFAALSKDSSSLTVLDIIHTEDVICLHDTVEYTTSGGKPALGLVAGRRVISTGVCLRVEVLPEDPNLKADIMNAILDFRSC